MLFPVTSQERKAEAETTTILLTTKKCRKILSLGSDGWTPISTWQNNFSNLDIEKQRPNQCNLAEISLI
jgi:hypothetical protein